MRTLLRLPLPLLVAALAVAEEKETAPPPAGKAALTEKKSCPLCKLPGRAALFAGNAKAGKCITDCADLCCKGRKVVFIVDGMTGPTGIHRINTALSSVEGAQAESITPQSGRVVLRYAPDQMTRMQLRKLISGCGYKVTGEQETFSLEGLTTKKLASTVEKAIRSDPGVHGIEAVCYRSGKAIVIFDPDRTSIRKIAAVINSTPCKVQLP